MRRRLAALALTSITAAFLALSLGAGSAGAGIDIDSISRSSYAGTY
ncbi:hypothetical protein [Embleya sp. NPDC005971]